MAGFGFVVAGFVVAGFAGTSRYSFFTEEMIASKSTDIEEEVEDVVDTWLSESSPF